MTMRKRRNFSFGPIPFRLATVLALAVAAGACTHEARLAYNGPGWYLEKPHLITPAAPQVYGGPFSYEDCEAARTKLPERTADQMLCFRHLAKPTFTGPYLTNMDMSGKLAPQPSSPQPAPASQ